MIKKSMLTVSKQKEVYEWVDDDFGGYMPTENKPWEMTQKHGASAYEPATDKQMAYLRILGVSEIPKTKLEAGELIAKAKK